MLRTAPIDIGAGRSGRSRHVLKSEWWRTGVGSLAPLVGLWLERTRTRRALAELDEHLLRDIGRSSIEARRESAQPFWKPGRVVG
jgi:uncharacterized protein YjiS (DUF1127 family)